MVVGNWEKFAFPLNNPSFFVDPLALGAMPVSARVVTYRLFTTTSTLGHMTAKSFCTAQGECSQGKLGVYRGLVFGFKLGLKKMNDIGNFMFGLQPFWGLYNRSKGL